MVLGLINFSGALMILGAGVRQGDGIWVPMTALFPRCDVLLDVKYRTGGSSWATGGLKAAGGLVEPPYNDHL